MLGKTEGRKRRGRQRTRWLEGIHGHKFEQTLRDSKGQGNLECCSPWGHEVLDMTERLNDNEQQEVRGSMETVMQFIEASLW